jgi:secondary thiamine-phosphate synthase enzyme
MKEYHTLFVSETQHKKRECSSLTLYRLGPQPDGKPQGDAMEIAANSFVITTPARQEFFDVTDQVTGLVTQSGIEAGVVLVYTPHTSCCVIIQEESEDVTYYGTQLILQDTLNVLAKIAPPARNEGQYLHPGPIHIKNAGELRGEHPSWGLNTDGHIISSVLGRSETIPVQEGRPVLGEFGRIYFGDLDSVRGRDRQVVVQVMGQ